MEYELALVMPVYNERECIADVLHSWLDVLSGLDIRFLMIVMNDGSSDGTGEALDRFAPEPRIEVVNKQNSGHGPTILAGYHKAVDLGYWVFQCDSDDEMKAVSFSQLWRNRNNYDALFGVRSGREQNFLRRLISAFSRITVKALFGGKIIDANTPYRLIRSHYLKQVVDQIPDDTFAPNLIISGALSKAGLRILNVPVPHEGRKTGTVSIIKWKLWKAAVKSFGQTLRCRPIINAVESEDRTHSGN